MRKEELEYEVAKAMGEIEDIYIQKDYGFQKSRRLKGAFLILVAIVGVLTAGITASGIYFRVVENRTLTAFSDELGYSPEQIAIIQETAKDIGVSVTDNGITLTVDAIVGDLNKAIVVYTFSNEDGTPFVMPILGKNEYFGFDRGFVTGTHVYVEGVSSNGGSSSVEVVDVDPSDGTVQVIETLEWRYLPIGQVVTAWFTNLVVYTPQYNFFGEYKGEESTVIYEGEWTLEYLFDYKLGGNLLEEGSFFHEGVEIHIDRLSITPFTVAVDLHCLPLDKELVRYFNEIDFAADSYLDLSKASKEEEEAWRRYVFQELHFFSSIPFYYTTTTGEIVEIYATFGSGHGSEREVTTGNGSMSFGEIIMLETIASVTFGDITVEVS